MTRFDATKLKIAKLSPRNFAVSKSISRPRKPPIMHVAIVAAVAAATYAFTIQQPQTAGTFVGQAFAATGELDTSLLPRISGTTEIYASALSTIFVTAESVTATAEATAKALAADGWQRYEAPFSQPAEIANTRIMTFKRGAHALNVFITIAPAQNNKTSVSYSAIPLAIDLPFLQNATRIQYDPNRPHLSFETSDAPDSAMTVLTREMTARGWSPWSVDDEAIKPEGATKPNDRGFFSFFVKSGQRPMIVLAQRHDDSLTHAKIEVVPKSLLKRKKPEPVAESAPAEAPPAADDLDRAFDQLAVDIMNHAREATKKAIDGMAQPPSSSPGIAAPPAVAAQGPVPAALRDTIAPIPLPETADSVEIDDETGGVDFLSSSSVRALASFYRAELAKTGWQEQPTVIDRENMAALRFAKANRDISITVMRMGANTKVSATGSGLKTASTGVRHPAKALAPPRDDEGARAAVVLEVKDIAGLPAPAPATISGSEKSLYRLKINSTVAAPLDAVLAFYRRELGKRSDWKEAPGATITADMARISYETADGPALLTLDFKDGDTTATLLVRKQAEAAKAGMLPKPGSVKLMLGNVLDKDATVTIGGKKMKVSGGAGAKKPDGPTLDIAPGRHIISFAFMGGKGSETVDVEAGDVWGIMVGPGGILPLQMY